MRASAFVALFVCGCFSPTPPSGVPCVDDEHCPSDQRCIAGRCGGGGGGDIDASQMAMDDGGLVIDGPPDDVDADTIKNMVDNCPLNSNLDQHDEDLDGVGDVCDNCPHVANMNQANTTEPAGVTDTVGDACDPAPTAGNKIEKFYTFNVLPTDISTSMGNWTVANDTIRNASNFNDAELTVNGMRDRVTVEISGTIEAVQGDTWLAVAVGENGTNPSKFYDGGYMDFVAANGQPADYHNGVIEDFDGNGFTLRAGNHQLNQRANGAFTIRVFADSTANLVRCTTIDSRQTANTQYAQADKLQPGLVGIKTYGATFTVKYLVVIGTL